MTNKNKEEISNQDSPDYLGHRQRLRLRFLSDEGRSMPDYELLELILMYAIPRRDVKPLAKSLIKQYGSLAGVLTAHSNELINVSGVGTNVAVLCSLIHACSNKICWENLENKDAETIQNKAELVEYCRTRIAYDNQEKVLVIYLNDKKEIIGQDIENSGTSSAVIISQKDIGRKALLCNASYIIISHNHPSGDCTPSRADIEMTQRLVDTLKTLNISLLDHIIISKKEYYSFQERGIAVKKNNF